MKNLIALFCGLALLSGSGLTRAGEDTGFYVGATSGRSDVKVSSGNYDFTGNDTGYKAFAGYNFGVVPFVDLAIEGSYVDFGNVSSSQTLNHDVGLTGWDLYGMAGLDLGPVDLFAKVGQVWWDSSAHFARGALNDSGNDMAYGIGARFQIGSLGLRAEYEYFDISIANTGYASVGVSWTF